MCTSLRVKKLLLIFDKQQKLFLTLFLSKSNAKVKVATEKRKLRNINDSILFGDNTKIKKLGWTQELTLSNIVDDQLSFYREQLKC